MTSIEWLEEQLKIKENINNIRLGGTKILNQLFQEAKEMHKEEIMDAQSYAISNADMTNNKGYFDCDKYYQETFKKD